MKNVGKKLEHLQLKPTSSVTEGVTDRSRRGKTEQKIEDKLARGNNSPVAEKIRNKVTKWLKKRQMCADGNEVLSEVSAVCPSAGHLCGLWDTLFNSGIILHGDIGVCVSMLLSALWVCPATLLLIGVCTTPRAFMWCRAGAGASPGAESGHTGTGHWKQKGRVSQQTYPCDQCFHTLNVIDYQKSKDFKSRSVIYF